MTAVYERCYLNKPALLNANSKPNSITKEEYLPKHLQVEPFLTCSDEKRHQHKNLLHSNGEKPKET